MDAPDFHLPDEVLSVIPTDPYDQLDLARKITSMAIASRVSNLESETTRLKQRVYDQDRLIFELQEKSSHLQQGFNEADCRLKLVLDENVPTFFLPSFLNYDYFRGFSVIFDVLCVFEFVWFFEVEISAGEGFIVSDCKEIES